MSGTEPWTITFAGGTLDRAAQRRSADAGVADGARMVLVGPGQTVAVADGSLSRLAASPEHELALLGMQDGSALYAADAGSRPEDEFESLRIAAGALPAAEAALAAYAVALVQWHRTHRFCGRCGTPTTATHSGHRRDCPACGLHVFPRTDPVVTMLIESGSRALLSRRRGATGTTWSALAGFIEAGETPEEALAREALEEVGVVVRDVEYVGSQPWPFPHALMLGYRARADADLPPASVHDTEELADARWFERAELRAALAAGTVTLPPEIAIGHRLISDWLERDERDERDGD